MVYFDTSFIASYYVEDVHSEKVAAAVPAFGSASLHVSDWTLTEFASLLALRCRLGDVEAEFARETLRLFEADVASSLVLLEPVRRDFERATSWLLQAPALGLRAPDALHLAIAARHDLQVHSLDRRLLDAAAALGVKATDGGVLGSG